MRNEKFWLILYKYDLAFNVRYGKAIYGYLYIQLSYLKFLFKNKAMNKIKVILN